MKYGNKNPKWKKIASSPILIFVLLILAFFLMRAVSNVGDKVTRIDQKLANANNEYQKLIDREKSLKEKVDFLSTDAGVEAELRSKYKAVAEGEMVVVILDDKKSTTSTSTVVVEKKGFFKKIFGWVF